MKKMRNLFLGMFVVIPFLSGCGDSSKWEYSKEDVSKFFSYTGEIVREDGKMYFNVDENYNLFSKDVTKDDVLVYSNDKLLELETSEKNRGDYITYDELKKCSVKATSVENNANRTGLKVYIPESDDESYCVLVNKCANNDYSHILLENKRNIMGDDPKERDILEQEKKRFEISDATWGDCKTPAEIVKNFCLIFCAVADGSYSSGFGAVFNFFTTIFDLAFGSRNPTLQDVLDKLNIMDAKLNKIQSTLEKNHYQMMDETVRTQAGVDKATLIMYEQNITSFFVEHTSKLDNLERSFQVDIADQYKAYVNGYQTVSISYRKNAQGKLLPVSLMEPVEATDQTFVVTLPEFKKAKEYLANNNNVVGKGFMDAFYLDVEEAIKDVQRPEGYSLDEFKENVTCRAADNLTRDFFKKAENKEFTKNLMNEFINFAKRISGGETTSIISSYLGRFQYMYNFAGEARNNISHILSYLLGKLESYACFVEQGLYFAEMSQDTVFNEYQAAKKALNEAYKASTKSDDAYCYVNNTIYTGGFYKAKWESYYTKTGNNPEFINNLSIRQVTPSGNTFIFKEPVKSMSEVGFISQGDLLRIVYRLKLMHSLGLEEETSFIKYLEKNKALEDGSIRAYEYLLSKQYLSSDALRIITEGITSRPSGSEDKNMEIWCEHQGGNPSTNYFKEGEKYYYQGKYVETYWAGQIAESVIFNASTGALSGEKRISGYATYDESRKLWINDEHWCFSDNPSGNYFFSLRQKPVK